MKKILLIIAAAGFWFGCKDKKAVAEDPGSTKTESISKIDTTLITDSSWGPITYYTNIEDLKNVFGDRNVVDETICGPECADSIDVTKIYPNTPREMVVYWGDSAYHKNVRMVESYMEQSPYHTGTGIKMGSTLNDILKVNGKKVVFYGFGWDYGGYITSYSDGKLASSSLGLDLDLKDYPGDEGLYGDRELHTDMPLVKKYLDKIVVTNITLSLDDF